MTTEERERFAKMEEKLEDFGLRLAKVEEHQEEHTELVKSVAAIAQKQTDMDSDIKEMKGDLKNIALKPAKRWDSIVDKAILAAVGILVAYIAVKIGLA